MNGAVFPACDLGVSNYPASLRPFHTGKSIICRHIFSDVAVHIFVGHAPLACSHEVRNAIAFSHIGMLE